VNLKETPTPEFPSISPLLIEALRRIFPDVLPRTVPGYVSDITRLMGQQDVIDRLKQEMHRQQGKFKQ
jgi:hypothetical protein